MSALLHVDVEMSYCSCIVCGVLFGLPKNMLDNHRRVGGYHYCPNGHSQGWEKGAEHTKIKDLEASLEAAREREARTLSRLNQEQAKSRHLGTQLKGAKTRLRNVKDRVANGVCPCCNRTFANLQRHMHTKHPEFKGDAP